MAGDTASPAALGFLTVVEHPQHGLFGGYLVLNPSGRPLEFHCTAPVKPNRAQQILYGPTLESFLYGEQIGATLVGKSELSVLVVLVDLPAMLSVREHIEVPAALVIADSSSRDDQSRREELELTVGRNRLVVPARYSADREPIAQRLTALTDLVDLSEPFGRIREAIEEAHRTSAKAA